MNNMASSEQDDLFGEDMNLGNGHIEDAPSPAGSGSGSEADEKRIQNLLSNENPDEIQIMLGEAPFDQSGKADDAIDYEDVSDDDLPDEEPTTATSGGDVPGLTDDAGTPDDLDDLFGDLGDDDQNPSAFDTLDQGTQALQNGMQSTAFDTAPAIHSPTDMRYINFNPPLQVQEVSSPEEIHRKAVKECPPFKVGVAPPFNQWMRWKEAFYPPRPIAKLPKALNHPKINLEIEKDQERAFRTAGSGFTSNRVQQLEEAASRGVILDLEPEEEVIQTDAFQYTPLDEDTIMNDGMTTVSTLRLFLVDTDGCFKPQKRTHAEMSDDERWIVQMGGEAKKQKLSDFEFINQPVYPTPSFDNYEELIAQTGSQPVLDMNDPTLLLVPVEQEPANKQRKSNGKSTTLSHFNISNDHFYEGLKASNQSKVRASIGNMGVEHSMPAIRCSWPYYKIKRPANDLRGWHRPALKLNKLVGHMITFEKSGVRKKKHLRGLSPKQIYAKSSDLSLNDNAHALLLEYSEEMPTVLNLFGMGNRIINYYRKANDEDQNRPKLDVGETHPLQPADESPFNKFGKVEPGQIVPTLHNSLYRAPIFKHEPKKNDFLVVRTTTGTNGSNWYIREIDHLYVVGQELPFKEVPGPHSRKVTTASRSRMISIANRILRKNPNHTMKVGDITKHIPDSADLQNRQKLKEFLKYDKEGKVWRTKPGEAILTEDQLRALVEPEDVCLIDAMQFGVRQLEDAGFAQTEEYNGEDDKATDSLVQLMAPWRTTKAFLEACSNKAMLELKGPGDPSGCGMAVSMVKTSMKGGFIKNLQGGPMGTSADAMERQRKANGGHDYNVHEQEAKYAQVLGEIWETQKAILSDTVEHTENDEEDQQVEAEQRLAQTPANVSTPANFDDSASMMSDARSTKQLRVTRQKHKENGDVETIVEIVRDPRVAREYMKRRATLQSQELDIYAIEPTGDPEADRAKHARAMQELARLQRNKDRREHRERIKARKAQGDIENNSPTPATPAPSDLGAGAGGFQGKGGETKNGKEKGKKGKTQPGTTQRKCAGCGAAGHIRTNQKLCPKLNGEWPNGIKPDGWVASGSVADGAGGDASEDANGAAVVNGNGAQASVAGQIATAPFSAFDDNGDGNEYDLNMDRSMSMKLEDMGMDGGATSPAFEL